MGKRLCIEAALRKKEGVFVFPLFALSFFPLNSVKHRGLYMYRQV
jgi:hypothetical protein